MEYTFVPDGNAGDFFGYQFFITYINRDRFSVSESYPIEDTRIVYVDLDLNDIATGTTSFIELRLLRRLCAYCSGGASAQPNEDLILVANTAIKSATIAVV